MESRIFWKRVTVSDNFGGIDMPLTKQTLMIQVDAGEDSGRQFKRDAHNVESPDWTRRRIEA